MLDCDVNYFEKLLLSLKGKTLSECPYQLVIEAYLYRSPGKGSKHKAHPNRDESFWHSNFVFDIPTSLYKTDDFILALARYFSQEVASNFSFVTHVFSQSPETVLVAIRRSQIVTNESHLKWDEIKALSSKTPDKLNSLIATSEAFQAAYSDRKNRINHLREPFKSLTLFELMSLSAVYSFKHLAEPAVSFDGGEIRTDSQLRALKKLTEWKLRHSATDEFSLSESKITKSLKKYHIPLVFPSDQDSSIAEALLLLFEELIQAQVEFDEFISQSVHPFCFDDSIEFSVKNERLILKTTDKASEIADNWVRNGNRQKALRGYWFNLAMDEFIASGMATQQIGTAENHDSNQIAYIKAIAIKLELQRIYGFTSYVTTSSGLNVNLFQALLSLELMTAFYLKDYIAAFYEEHAGVGGWQGAVALVALKGAATGQNRFPITWSRWKEKAQNIVGWTVSNDFPTGNIKSAEAIMDFWCLDLRKYSQVIKNSAYLNLPLLTEKPIFKIGQYCVELPWLMSSQLGSVSAVNNLRRFANQRSSLKDETTRIENQLGDAFERRGFTVVRNFEDTSPLGKEAGEVDLICAIDNIVIVIEVKSTFNRTTKDEIYYHRDKTLRKAGIQVRKKTKAVRANLQEADSLIRRINLTTSPRVIGLIADTSIEFDHEYFSGAMKLSIEELIIALADNAHLLCDQEKEISRSLESNEELSLIAEEFTLYPNGFNGGEFIKVLEQSRVWERYEQQYRQQNTGQNKNKDALFNVR
ncbi:hypothetical protein [uncultured Shewanella sp.]|uniref:hypothetical protein n=1 Tax=uncultured Shewanella sp. TaxID=173975 RepID=UPI0026268441|nr:hypothetical protein [uncultured Shewanella sp.]